MAVFAATTRPRLASILSRHHRRRKLRRYLHIQEDRTPRRILFGSCAHQDEDLTFWDRMVEMEPDLSILMGDNVYGRSLKSLEEAYVTMLSHPSFRRATKAFPIVATLDDNDYCLNAEEKDKSKELFLNFFDVKKTDARWNPSRGVYTSYHWKNILSIVLLDTRYSKDAFPESGNPKAPFLPSEDKSKTILGEVQWEWLEQELQREYSLTVLVSPIQVLADGHGWECWRMFPHERQRLLNLLENKNHLILSGDRHVGGVYQRGSHTEVTSSSLTHPVPFGLLDYEEDVNRIGDYVYKSNFGCLDIDWETMIARLALRCSKTGKTISAGNIQLDT